MDAKSLGTLWPGFSAIADAIDYARRVLLASSREAPAKCDCAHVGRILVMKHNNHRASLTHQRRFG